MKNDDSSFIKKHFEKLLLAGAALFLVVIGAMFFTDTLGNPFAVEVRGSAAAPDEVIEILDREGKNLNTRLQTADPIGPEPPVIPNYSEEFVGRVSAPVASDEPLPVPIGDTSYALIDAEAITIDLPRLYVPPVPLPDGMVAEQYSFVLDEGNVPDNQVLLELRGQIGEQRPPDFAMVSVRGFWDQEGWIAELGKTHRVPGFDEAPLTVEIFGTKTFPVGVLLIRQTLDPATGTWGARTNGGEFVEGAVTQCPPLPDIFQAAVSVDDRFTDPLTPIEEFIEFLSLPDLLAVTTQPTVPPLAHGDTWHPPGTMPDLPALAGGGAAAPELDQRAIARERLREERLRRERDQALRAERGAERGVGQAGANAPTARPGQGLDRRRERDTARAAAEREREALLRRRAMEEAGMPQGIPGMPGGIPGGGPAGPRDIVAPAGSITVWGHDLIARPGQTYRYKLVVNAINPLFGFNRLPPEQQDMARRQIAVGPGEELLANAPWSEPVKVEPMLEFFVTGGRAGQPATVEVFRRHDGRWHTETFQPAPGDLIGAADVQGQINMDTGSVVVDILSEKDDQGTEINSLLLVDQAGNMQVRDIRADRSSDRRKELKSRIENQQLAAGNVGVGVQP
ncbi:MAG: hypothetical protein AAF750_05415 [Planctomycetota bacterium]